MENKLGYEVVVMILKYTLFAYLCYKYEGPYANHNSNGNDDMEKQKI